MTNLEDLCCIAEQENICIIDMHIKRADVSAISVCDDEGDCIIAIDSRKTKNVPDCKVKTAHELGHCIKGAFYNRYSNLDVISKHEYQADKWAVQKLMPSDEFLQAVQNGCVEVWELAEYFDVTEDFVRRACEIYRAMGIL